MRSKMEGWWNIVTSGEHKFCQKHQGHWRSIKGHQWLHRGLSKVLSSALKSNCTFLKELYFDRGSLKAVQKLFWKLEMNKGKDFSAGCKFSTVTCKRSQKKCLTQQWIRLPIRRNCLFDWKPAGRCWIWALRDEPVWRDQQVTPAKLHLTKLLRSVSVDVIGAEKPNLLCIASPHLNHWLCSVLILVWPWLFGVSQQVVITSLL